MQRVRDKAIEQWDMAMTGKMKDSSSKKFFERVSQLSEREKEMIRVLIPSVVDTTLHHLLWTLDQVDESIQIAVQTPIGNVNNLNEVSDGLAGELPTENGWIGRFSNQRDVSF